MSARSMMTMRALVVRNMQADRDTFNQKAQPDWQPVGPEIPCFVWAGPVGGKHAVASGELVMIIDMPGAVFPKSANVCNGDRLKEVRDRLGQMLFEDLVVESIFPRRTHKEARLKAYAELEG